MVYHKGRRVSELITILDVLYALRLRYSLVIYGRYGEEEYREFLNKSSFVIWHGVSETQGIAMQEAMACSIPILVCDVSTLGDDAEGSAYPDKLKALPVTAAPYFDKTCGIRITNLVDLKDAVCSLLDEIDDYRPREYVLEHLSLERQASRFVQLWETWGLGVDKGYGERPATLKPFTEPTSARVQRLAYKAMRELFPPSDERNG
jgi:glycosyltransferase involved in cell wall biosynthesis